MQQHGFMKAHLNTFNLICATQYIAESIDRQSQKDAVSSIYLRLSISWNFTQPRLTSPEHNSTLTTGRESLTSWWIGSMRKISFEWRRLEVLHKKKAKLLRLLTFLLRWRDTDVTLTFLRQKRNLPTPATHRILTEWNRHYITGTHSSNTSRTGTWRSTPLHFTR